MRWAALDPSRDRIRSWLGEGSTNHPTALFVIGLAVRGFSDAVSSVVVQNTPRESIMKLRLAESNVA
jgi:hypothetical protein